MIDRCELCGARLRDEDKECRECGAPRFDAPKSALPEVGPVHSDPELPAVAFDEPFSDPGLAAPPDAPLLPPPEFAGGMQPAPLEFADERQAPATSHAFGPPTSSISLEGAVPRRFPIGVVLGALVLLVGGSVAAGVMMGGNDDQAAAESADAAGSAGEGQAAARAGEDGDDGNAIDRCEGIDALQGSWVFATQVTGARVKSKLDIRGYYAIDIEVDGCTAQASLSKTGYTGSTFPERHVQKATATLQPGTGPFAGTFEATFELRDTVNRGVDLQLGFAVRDGKLMALSRERGSRWDKTGLYGVGLGVREGDVTELVPTVAELPCESRCTMTCDGLRREQLADEAMSACVASCEGGEALPACGDRKPPDAELALELQGPRDTLDELCAPLACELSPRLEKRRPRAVKPDDGVVGVDEAHLVRKGDPGGLHVALRTEAGWFLSAEILALDGKERDKAISRARVGATTLGSGQSADTVVGTFVDEERGAHVFACRLESGRPVCVLARGLADLDRAAPLPGQTFAVYRDGEALFAW